MTVTVNLYKDRLRKKRIRSIMSFHSFLSGDDDDSTHAGIKPLHEENPARFEVEEAIQKSLASLSENQKRVFILKEIEGYKHQEISKILHIPVGTVKSLLFRAVKNLQKDLIDYKEASNEV